MKAPSPARKASNVMPDHATQLEQAQALGFNSLEECEQHQNWLDRQTERQALVSAAVQTAETAGTPCIDLRFLATASGDTAMTDKMRQFVADNVAEKAPVACDFQPGDTVTVTNGYGVEIPGVRVLGFIPVIDPEFRPESFIYLDWDCYWFTVAPDRLKLEKRAGL